MNRQKTTIYTKKVGDTYHQRIKISHRSVDDVWFEVDDQRHGKDMTKERAIEMQEDEKEKIIATQIQQKVAIDDKAAVKLADIDADLVKLKS